MPHTEHQQNETTPTGGRDLGQITLQTFSIRELISMAESAKKAAGNDHDTCARFFFANLVGVIESRYGETTAKTLADALGFNYLFEEF